MMRTGRFQFLLGHLCLLSRKRTKSPSSVGASHVQYYFNFLGTSDNDIPVPSLSGSYLWLSLDTLVVCVSQVLAYASQVHKVVLPQDCVDHEGLTLEQVASLFFMFMTSWTMPAKQD